MFSGFDSFIYSWWRETGFYRTIHPETVVILSFHGDINPTFNIEISDAN